MSVNDKGASWQWPRYFPGWLQRDRDGDPYNVPKGEDCLAVGVDRSGQRAMSPVGYGRRCTSESTSGSWRGSMTVPSHGVSNHDSSRMSIPSSIPSTSI
jgi:hypothetical protein